MHRIPCIQKTSNSCCDSEDAPCAKAMGAAGFRPAWPCPCSAGAGCELLEFWSLFERGHLFWAVRYVGGGSGGWWAVRGVGSEVDHSLD